MYSTGQYRFARRLKPRSGTISLFLGRVFGGFAPRRGGVSERFQREVHLRIRSARDGDWQACLDVDLSYETESAWQMTELRGEGEWGMRFREVRLPRRQRMMPTLSPEVRLKGWERRDGFWVAVERRKVVGYLTLLLEPEHRQARIADLVVAPEFRRQGIASELLIEVTEWCQRRETDQLILECALKAQPAISFAQHHGFTFCGFQDAYWPGQETALFFRKRIR